MAGVRRTAKAEEDLVDLRVYIAQGDTVAADRLLEESDRKFALLAENPGQGRDRPRGALFAGRKLPHPLPGG